MLGLFGTLNLATRSLQTQQQAVEVTGQNLANVNNTAYSRQRVQLQSSPTLPTDVGQQGTGVDVVAIQQLRDALVDRQITNETSVGGYWIQQQNVLQYAETNLGEQLGNSTSATGSATNPGSATGSYGLSADLNALFNSFQSLSVAPDSITERQLVVDQAQQLSARFQEIDGRLGDLSASVNSTLDSDVDSANQLLGSIADLNNQIDSAELNGGTANDLRDLRQQKIESLAKLVTVDTQAESDGSVSIFVGATQLVSGQQVLDTLQTYDAGGGQVMVRTATGLTPLTLTGGSMAGTIDARDGALATLRAGVNTLAAQLISEVNAVHNGGFSLTGSTRAAFFTGTNASDIQVNSALVDDPSLLQASGTPGAIGDNQVALALAQLADKKITGLGGQTFSGDFSQSVAQIGQSLASANAHVNDQQAIHNLLQQQRDSISGVSLDEEMANLVGFQRAYEASAKLVATVDQMLATIIGLKQ